MVRCGAVWCGVVREVRCGASDAVWCGVVRVVRGVWRCVVV